MSESDDRSIPSRAQLRDVHARVSERYAAVELGTALVVFDTDDAERWLCADNGVALDEMR